MRLIVLLLMAFICMRTVHAEELLRHRTPSGKTIVLYSDPCPMAGFMQWGVYGKDGHVLRHGCWTTASERGKLMFTDGAGHFQIVRQSQLEQ